MILTGLHNSIARFIDRVTMLVGRFSSVRCHYNLFKNFMMPFSFRSLWFGAFFVIMVGMIGSFACYAQTNYYAPSGGEYSVVNPMPGDQVFSEAAFSVNGGYLVWQDNATDGDGLGVSAQRLDSSFSGYYGTFRVNVSGAGDQKNPQVALLKNGGAVFVWQGGVSGAQHIYARFITSSGTFLTTNDVLVNSYTNSEQLNPGVAVLTNGNVVVVWASNNQANSTSMQDIYGQILSQSGQKIGSEFLINQFTGYNQRTPAVVSLIDGGFVVTWVSEQQRTQAVSNQSAGASFESLIYPSVDIYARIYGAQAIPSGNEFIVNTDSNICANPDVAAATDGSFMVTWGGQNVFDSTNGWDIYARPFSAIGAGGSEVCVNQYLYGDQYAPKIAALNADYLIGWTSLAQDGSGSGVYGRVLHSSGALSGDEFRINTTTASRQMLPTIASDGNSQFEVVWSSFTEASHTFDLLAQRYGDVGSVLPVMDAPFVWAPFVTSNGVYQPELMVSWANMPGLSVSNYLVYVDGAATPMASVVSNQWTMSSVNGLAANSTHAFRVNYVTTDGRSPAAISPATSGSTWSSCNYMNSGIPCDWISAMYGTNTWPYSVSAPVAPGGPTLFQVFLSGGDPLDSSTWLHTSLENTSQGMYVHWNCKPGFTYQVQTTTNFVNWQNLGAPRFAAGSDDSIYVGTGSVGYYRVVLLR